MPDLEDLERLICGSIQGALITGGIPDPIEGGYRSLAAAIIIRAVRDVAHYEKQRAEAIDFILSPECHDFLTAAGIRLDVTAEDIIAASQKLYRKKPKHIVKKEQAKQWA